MENTIEWAQSVQKQTPEKLEKVEIPLYTIYKDGNSAEHKVCNMDHPDVCPRKGHIVIEAIRKSKRHETNIGFTNVRDRNSGIVYGIYQGIDTRTKEILYQRIHLGDREEYNLENLQDARVWAVVSRYNGLEGSPFQYGKPMFRVHNKEAEAEKTIAKIKNGTRAVAIAESLKGGQLLDMSRNLGIPPEHNSMGIMLSEIMKKAQENPDAFLSVWDNTNRQVLTIINRAKAVGLLRYDSMKGFLWREGLPIGSNDMQMIDYLVKNVQLLTTMDHDSKELDNFYKEHGNAAEVKINPIKDELTRELEDLRKMKEELAIELKKKKDKNNPKQDEE